VEEQPRPISDVSPGIPEWLSTIIARLHAKQPADRFQSAREVSDLLGRHLMDLERTGGAEQPVSRLDQVPAAAVAAKPEGVTVASTTISRTKPLHTRRPGRTLIAAASLGIMVVGLSLSDASGLTKIGATVIRLFSETGTLVIEVDDPAIGVAIDGDDLVITGAGPREIRVKPGQHTVRAIKDGKLVSEELVTVTKNGRQIIRVSKEPEPDAKCFIGASGVQPPRGGESPTSIPQRRRLASRAKRACSEHAGERAPLFR
jgi:hypothetical protein